MVNVWNGKMKPKKVAVTNICIGLLFMLSACAQTNTKDDVQPQNMFEIETLANQTYKNNQWRESEKHYTVLVEEIPENAIHWFRLGNIYARTQRPDAAVLAYRESLIRDPKFAKAWYNMGVLHLQQAANSFSEFQLYVDKNDPLYEKGQKLFVDTVNIIKQDSGDVE